MIDLRLGRWQDVLANVEPAVLLADPPYSDRTHEGQRTGSSIRMTTIGYESVDEAACFEIAKSWAPRTKWWAVIFCDHTAFRWHEAAWEAEGWLTFAPLLVKQNPTPRFSGDGPAFGLEFIMAARRRTSARKSGSLPAYYEVDMGGDRKSRSIAGRKDLGMMRAIVRDYSEIGDLIADPFAGSGTTAIACATEDRECITSEKDPAHYAIAQARIARGHTPDMFAKETR